MRTLIGVVVGNVWRGYCDRCRRWHVHGWCGGGHRAAHCDQEDSEGYMIEVERPGQDAPRTAP
jgi:hypothetical protein